MKLPHLYSKASGRLRGAAIMWIVPVALLLWSGTGQAMEAVADTIGRGRIPSTKFNKPRTYRKHPIRDAARKFTARKVVPLLRLFRVHRRSVDRMERWLAGVPEPTASAEKDVNGPTGLEANGRIADTSTGKWPYPAHVSSGNPNFAPWKEQDQRMKESLFRLAAINGQAHLVLQEVHKNGSGTYTPTELRGQLELLNTSRLAYLRQAKDVVATFVDGWVPNPPAFRHIFSLQLKQLEVQASTTRQAIAEARQALAGLPTL